MKSAEKLLISLGDLPEDLILEADPASVNPLPRKRRPVRTVATAVAAALVLALTLSFLPFFFRDGSTEQPSGDGTGTGGFYSSNVDPGPIHKDPTDDVPEPQVQKILSAEDLFQMFRSVPQHAWNGVNYSVWDNGYGRDIDIKAFRILSEQGLLDPATPAYPDDWTNPSYPRIPYETVMAAYREVWGPFYVEEYMQKVQSPTHLTNNRAFLIYEESTNSYVFYNYPFDRYPTSVGDHFYARLVRVEQEGENLYVYVRYACYDTEGGEFTIYGEQGGWLGAQYEKTRSVLLRGYDGADYETNPNSAFQRLHAGCYDEYLPIYRIQFRPDANYDYWWQEALEVQDGTKIPAEALSRPVPAPESLEGIKLAVEGEKDAPASDENPYPTYMDEEWLHITVNGAFCRYRPVAGYSEPLTPKDLLTTFSQTVGETEILWEVYTAAEHPDGYGLVLFNPTDGTVQHFYNFSY